METGREPLVYWESANVLQTKEEDLTDGTLQDLR